MDASKLGTKVKIDGKNQRRMIFHLMKENVLSLVREIKNEWYILTQERKFICKIILIPDRIAMKRYLFRLKHHIIE